MLTSKFRVLLALACIALLAACFIVDLAGAEPSYEGREPDAAWRAGAAERIEKYRKGDIEITVVDRAGKPVKGATVDFAMKRHLFRFGAAVRPERLIDPSTSEDRYREAFLKNFNSATVPKFYDYCWHDPKVAEQSSKIARASIEWLKQHDKYVFAHVLVWNLGHGGQKSEGALETENTRERVWEHFRKTIGNPEFSEKMDGWHVLNEPAENNEVYDLLGKEEAVQWFKRARQYAPNATLVLNETHLCASTDRAQWPAVLKSTENLIRDLQAADAPVDALGIQSHFVGSVTSIPTVLETLERLSKLNVDLLITEYDLRLIPTVKSKKDWQAQWKTPLGRPVGAEMEQLEADYLRDYLTACFSEPKVKEFTMWGFWDGDQWLFNAPLYRKDWTLKPAGKVWQNLTQHVWWTEGQSKTDKNGKARMRGFLGEYDITVSGGSKKKVFKLSVADYDSPTRATVNLDTDSKAPAK